MSDLTNRMRGTLQLMAQSCVAPTVLWNDHANAVLEAAAEIERLDAELDKLRTDYECASIRVAELEDVHLNTTI